jgi:hypothetical protein
MGKKTRKVPSSFSFDLMAGEKLVYPRGSITPRCAYHVVGSPIAMSDEIVMAWFLESIEPLIGPEAVNELRRLFKENPAQFERFFEHTRHFRAQLK